MSKDFSPDKKNVDYSFSLVEKLFLTPLYLFEKLGYMVLVCNLWVARCLSELFGFKFDYSFEEPGKWKWLEDLDLPRFIIKRVE